MNASLTSADTTVKQAKLLINGEWRDHFTFYITKESYVQKAHEAKSASG